jgi:hypothetical protein
MADTREGLAGAAGRTFATKADEFVREAIDTYAAEPALGVLRASQWGAMQALVAQYGTTEEICIGSTHPGNAPE